jgi:hypothetical protein
MATLRAATFVTKSISYSFPQNGRLVGQCTPHFESGCLPAVLSCALNEQMIALAMIWRCIKGSLVSLSQTIVVFLDDSVVGGDNSIRSKNARATGLRGPNGVCLHPQVSGNTAKVVKFLSRFLLLHG